MIMSNNTSNNDSISSDSSFSSDEQFDDIYDQLPWILYEENNSSIYRNNLQNTNDKVCCRLLSREGVIIKLPHYEFWIGEDVDFLGVLTRYNNNQHRWSEIIPQDILHVFDMNRLGIDNINCVPFCPNAELIESGCDFWTDMLFLSLLRCSDYWVHKIMSMNHVNINVTYVLNQQHYNILSVLVSTHPPLSFLCSILEYKPNINIKDHNGENILHIAAKINPYLFIRYRQYDNQYKKQLINLLLEIGVLCNQYNNSGELSEHLLPRPRCPIYYYCYNRMRMKRQEQNRHFSFVFLKSYNYII
jgi:hypothetical protein